MRPDPQSTAMRALTAKLLACDDANRHIGGLMSGLSTRYDLGSEIPGVGRLLGNIPVNTTPLYDLMQDATPLLLDATPHQTASTLAKPFASIRCIPVAQGPSMLIRPDACLAWLNGQGYTAGLQEACGRWFSA